MAIFLAAMWIKALDQVPAEGTMAEVTLNEQDLLVALHQGRLYCAENRCPHEEVKLTLGCLKANRIQCSLHGFSFDLATGDSSQQAVDNLRVYPVRQENNKVYIDI